MRLAFIGGRGHHYLRGLLSDPTVSVQALAVASDTYDPQAASDLARGFQKNHPQLKYFDDPVAMLDEFKPSIVSVGSVYGYNGQINALCLMRDIPTVSDKPAAATWEQFDRLRRMLETPGRLLLTEFPFRAQPEFRAARQTIADNKLGQPVLLTAQKSYRFRGSRPRWFADRQAYAGTLLWVASHGIDLIRFVSGQRYMRVFGWQGNVSKPDYGSMEDHALAMFELESGATALVHADYLRPDAAPTHGDDRLRVACAAGVMEVRQERCQMITHAQAETDITGLVPSQPMHRDLLDALEGRDTMRFNNRETLESARMLLYARDAADGRRVIEIPKEY